MQVYKETGNLPAFRNGVITIGTFDGVHTGHRQIIAQLKEEAAAINGETVIITFHPHPRRIVGDASKQVQLLTTIEEKTALLADAGIDHLVICPFTETFSQLTAEEYITEFLIKKFHPDTIVIGYDHGDYKLLENFRDRYGFRLTEIPAHIINESTVSSTKIRQALLAGETSAAADLLGYNYFFQGRVTEGKRLGRTLGFPTANLDIQNPEKLIPGNGVYAVQAHIESGLDNQAENAGKFYDGMMNIGTRPTVDDNLQRSIEVNLFGFSGDLYGKDITVVVRDRIRGEQKFAGIEALKTQLANDRETSQRMLRNKSIRLPKF
jgi:riboflavin kinase / FMN adenylyltransferase